MRRAVLLLLLFAGSGPALAREKIQVWTDANGVVHVEDALPGINRRGVSSSSRSSSAANGKSSGKTSSRGTSRSSSSREGRWWERATDAPPDEIDRAASVYRIPAELIRAVISVESAGDTSAVSRAGAKGLMQLMPQTAGHVYVDDPVDPAQNIQGGTRYLRELANQFNGDMVLVLAAYNAGPDAVRKYKGVPPFPETRDYVRRVMAHYNDLKRENAAHKQVASAPAQPQMKPQASASAEELAQAGTQGRGP